MNLFKNELFFIYTLQTVTKFDISFNYCILLFYQIKSQAYFQYIFIEAFQLKTALNCYITNVICSN